MGRAEIKGRFDEIVEFSGVEQFIDTPVKRYSSGMTVRLAFAVAAHLEPEILIIDEVLAVGDAEFQKKCLGKMQDVAGHGRTVLFVSHSMSAVQSLCTRAVLMRAGQVHLNGKTEDVIGKYVSDAATQKDGCFDLTKSPARAPNMAPIVTGLMMCSGNATTASFHPYDKILVVVSLSPTKTIRNARLAIAIEDHMGRRITTAATYFSHTPTFDITGPTNVECELEELPLGEGRYLISVSIATKEAGLLDSLDNAAWFDVSWRDRYGHGEPYHPCYGSVLTESRWRIVSSESSTSIASRLSR